MICHLTIIGGGLAGLSLSIDLAKRGYNIVVIEKGHYPRQKVCGEYISMESHRYLKSICPSLKNYVLPSIRNFKLTSTGKNVFQTKLNPGGFGISRFLLEDLLYKEAINLGVNFYLDSKADSININRSGVYNIVKSGSNEIFSELICDCSGRKSNFEAKRNKRSVEGVNYIGIKYHVRHERTRDLIEIHNFPGGYCGISDIEDGKSCLCYIVNSEKLKEVGNSIEDLQTKYLYKNSHLKNIFQSSGFLFEKPVTISGINFKIKKQVGANVLYAGDSAGSIAPITGNGMSMALRSASYLAKLIDEYFSSGKNKRSLEEKYSGFWRKEFSSRIKLSRYFQRLSEYPVLTNFTINTFNTFPSLANTVIGFTHGKSF